MVYRSRSIISHVLNGASLCLSLTCKSCLCLYIDWSEGEDLGRWLTAQCQSFSDNFTSVPHSPTQYRLTVQTHILSSSQVCHQDFSFIPMYFFLFSTHHLHHRHNQQPICLDSVSLHFIMACLSISLTHTLQNRMLNIVISVPVWRLTTSWKAAGGPSSDKTETFHWWLQLLQNQKICQIRFYFNSAGWSTSHKQRADELANRTLGQFYV